jgi:peroxiredoxin
MRKFEKKSATGKNNTVTFFSIIKKCCVLLVLSFLLYGCGTDEAQGPLKAELNKPAPDFTLVDLQGNTWKLSDLKGNVVFINFWATWCSPCIEEMPSMQKLYLGMQKAPFKMLAILNNDRPEYAQNLTTRMSITFPILIDPDSKVATQYGLTGVPETFIVDAQGILREKFIGPRNWNSQGAMQMLRNYLPVMSRPEK